MSGGNHKDTPLADQGTNDYMELQHYQDINTVTGAEAAGASSVGDGETERSNMKVASQNGMKRCLIALTLAVLLMILLMTIVAFALAVFNYNHAISAEEVANKLNLISSQQDQLLNNTNKLSIQYQQSVASTRDDISQIVVNLNTIKNYIFFGQIKPNCGAGLWYRVAFLNMSDPSQQCPSAWRLVTTNGVRACGRPVSSESSCNGTFYSAINEYQRVCGRVIGYQQGTPDGFGHMNRGSINDAYLDGVSITYGQPRKHVWSYAAGYTENSASSITSNCPCAPMKGDKPQSFVGDNYYCESGNPTNQGPLGILYNDDKLWDGKQCDHEGTCCTDSNSPPWFSVRLSNHTTESIEVRICGDQGTGDEDTPIELLEIYVQ